MVTSDGVPQTLWYTIDKHDSLNSYKVSLLVIIALRITIIPHLVVCYSRVLLLCVAKEWNGYHSECYYVGPQTERPQPRLLLNNKQWLQVGVLILQPCIGEVITALIRWLQCYHVY